MPRVTLLANYLPDEQESMQRYVALLRRLLEARGWPVEVIRPEPFFGRLKRSGQGLGKWLGYLDKFILFPFALRRHVRGQKRRDGAFLIHVCDHSNAMYTRWLRDAPHLVTCHDVMAIQSALGLIPGQTTRWTGRCLQNWILSGLRRARAVVAISNETRRDLIALLPEKGAPLVAAVYDRRLRSSRPPDHGSGEFEQGKSTAPSRNNQQRSGWITTVEIPLPYPFTPMPADEARKHLHEAGLAEGDLGDGFFLHVGGNQWYKNREGLIRIFARVGELSAQSKGGGRWTLVMAGKPPTAEMLRLVEEEKLAGKVIFLHSPSNEQIRALYSLAVALLFPSLKEGFGWPVVEAQACGCPVVTSDRPPMNRVAGPAAQLADPLDADAFARRALELADEAPESRMRRQAAALRHAAGYDPERFLEEMETVYRDALRLAI